MQQSKESLMALSDLYNSAYSAIPSDITPLPPSGGNRRYYRLTSPTGPAAIGVEGTDLRENAAFIYLSNALRRAGINVPEVTGVSADGRLYIQEDLGDTSLFSLLGTPRGDALMEEAVRKLPAFQCAADIDTSAPMLQRPFSSRGIMADLNYFKYCFMKPSGVEPDDEDRLQDDFEALCRDVENATSRLQGLMYRDCQSRNIMVRDDSVWWIDFQGARRGPLLYDIVSLLWQARAGLSGKRRAQLLEVYFKALEELRDVPSECRHDVPLFALLRTLQVLGAYGFRGLVEHKAHFITSIPPAIGNLRSLLDSGAGDRYPTLRKVLQDLCGRYVATGEVSNGKLTVEVMSFSYKKGYPADMSGNGGGFMFDCRALHNPGRYDRYKPLTGMDREVIDFLESRGEVRPFLEAAMALTDPAVERYLQRGFTHLQIGFGCTGGRHRSVYCAERMAAHLHEKYGDGINIRLRHREQNVEKEF